MPGREERCASCASVGAMIRRPQRYYRGWAAFASTSAFAALPIVTGCLPDNPTVETSSASGSGGESESESDGAGGEGLLACDLPSCTFVVVSQTLDDRVDIFDVSASPQLRGRVVLDLKPDPSGLQTAGNLLDEPYGIDVVDGELRILLGHYPDTKLGSLVVLPEGLFAGLQAGSVIDTVELFDGGNFVEPVWGLELDRQEAIFALSHSSGRTIIGVFANDARALEWPNASQLLIVDPSREGAAAIGAFDMGSLDVPCRGAWGIAAVDDLQAPQRVALACDGSDSVAMLELPQNLGELSPAGAASAISGCGVELLGAGWTTRFVARDGSGGALALQSQLVKGPRIWRVGGACEVLPATESVAKGFSGVRTLAEPVLLQGGATPTWLVAGGVPETGIYVIRGADPTLCGKVSGLEGVFTPPGGQANAPYSLALTPDGRQLAIGSGPPSNPESAEGRGQVHWLTLDTAEIEACEIAATEVVVLTGGAFVGTDPQTWVRAPNVIKIVQRSGVGT